MVEMENGAPANFLVSRDPPTLVCRGAGGWRAISWAETEIQYYIVLRKNDDVPTVGPTWRCPHGGQVWIARAEQRDVLNLVHELEEKGASQRALGPAIDAGGPMGRMVLTVLGLAAEMELGFIRDRLRAGIDAAKAKGVYKGALSRSAAHALGRCARKEWAPLRSRRASDAKSGV
jgi:hypothetical protein